MDGIIDALLEVDGSEPEDRAAIALALCTIMRGPTRQLVQEWLDQPLAMTQGATARQMIEAGRGADLATGLWNYIDEEYSARV